MAIVAEDIKNAAKLLGTDLIIAYTASPISTNMLLTMWLQADGSHRIWKEQCARYVMH